MTRLFILFLFILSFSLPVHAQNVSATLNADTNNVLIGEQIRLTLNVNAGNAKNITFPVFADTIGKIEIIKLFPVDTVRDKNSIISYKKDMIVTSFDSGSYEIPPFVISYETDNDSEIKLTQTNSLTLNFATVEVDTAGMNIRDIKPPIGAPFGLEDLLPYIITVAGLFVLYYLLIVVFGRKRNKSIKIIPKYDPKIPADLEALEALKRLEKENLWQNGKYKLYHSKLTDILRVYIHRRYHLNALEMTSLELVEEIKRYESNNTSLEALTILLDIADLAKFAKYEPNAEENNNSLKLAFTFVNLTKILDIDGDDGSNDKQGAE